MRKNLLYVLLICIPLCIGSAAAEMESAYQKNCKQQGLQSEDLIAWLEMPGGMMLEPVMRHPKDDTYYANHAADGSEYENGALFVQAKYNSDDFTDPVVLIYGSSTSEGESFGNLQEMYSGSFDSCQTIFLHRPERTYEYRVFAALPYSSLHILHYYDFNIDYRFNGFFDSVFSTRALGMHLEEEERPKAGNDQVIILSTKLRGDPLQRYLVMAKRLEQ